MNLNQRQMAVFMEVGPLADKARMGQGMWLFNTCDIFFPILENVVINTLDKHPALFLITGQVLFLLSTRQAEVFFFLLCDMHW